MKERNINFSKSKFTAFEDFKYRILSSVLSQLTYFLILIILIIVDDYYLILLLAISLILIASTNIFAKRTSSILKILGYLLEFFGYIFLFLILATFPLAKMKNFYENYWMTGLMTLNLIGLAIVFFRTKSYLEKIKFFLLFNLIISQFIFTEIIIYSFYYLTNIALLILLIFQEKLKIHKFSTVFVVFLMAIFILMLLYLGMSFGLMAEETSKLRILFIVIALLLNIIILPLIATLSYVILQKSKLKIQSKLKNQLI
jgi:hypothetical protein